MLSASSHIESLDLTGCELLGDGVCSGLPSAQNLNLSFVPISDSGLWNLGRYSPQLKKLSLARRSNNLWSVGHYSEAGVARLRVQLPQLEVVYTM